MLAKAATGLEAALWKMIFNDIQCINSYSFNDHGPLFSSSDMQAILGCFHTSAVKADASAAKTATVSY